MKINKKKFESILKYFVILVVISEWMLRITVTNYNGFLIYLGAGIVIIYFFTRKYIFKEN